MAVEHYGANSSGRHLPGEQSVTSLRQSWGPRRRDIGPKPVFQLVYEKSKLAEERKHGPLGPSLFKSHGIDLKDVSAQDINDLRSLLSPWKSRMEHIMQLPEHNVYMAYGVAPQRKLSFSSTCGQAS